MFILTRPQGSFPVPTQARNQLCHDCLSKRYLLFRLASSNTLPPSPWYPTHPPQHSTSNSVEAININMMVAILASVKISNAIVYHPYIYSSKEIHAARMLLPPLKLQRAAFRANFQSVRPSCQGHTPESFLRASHA